MSLRYRERISRVRSTVSARSSGAPRSSAGLETSVSSGSSPPGTSSCSSRTSLTGVVFDFLVKGLCRLPAVDRHADVHRPVVAALQQEQRVEGHSLAADLEVQMVRRGPAAPPDRRDHLAGLDLVTDLHEILTVVSVNCDEIVRMLSLTSRP